MSERQRSILLIDDDEDDYIIVEALLSDIQSETYCLEWVADYDEALHAISRNQYDAYLLDYHLGGEHSGLDLLEEAMAGGCTGPFIFLTGQGGQGVDAEALRRGASDYLLKGEITASLLERSIRYSIEQKRVERELRKYESHLQELVKERTAQLEDVNRALQEEIANRQHMEARLRQAEKLEAIGTLAGGIAHDFNNILAAIIGYTELSVFDLPEWNPIRKRLEQVLKAGNRAKDLVEQLLTFSRTRTDPECRAVDLNAIVKEAVRFLRSTLPATIAVRENIPAEPSTILADPTQIHQLLMNLCTNAAQAMENVGGVLEVNLSHEEAPSENTRDHSNPRHCRCLKLTVSDTGHGMAPDTLERVFDPYFTTKEIGKGSGLGLAVAHGIVKCHEGTTVVHSEPGKGTTFEVYLPELNACPLEIGLYQYQLK